MQRARGGEERCSGKPTKVVETEIRRGVKPQFLVHFFLFSVKNTFNMPSKKLVF
jgi:hypothetical protein